MAQISYGSITITDVSDGQPGAQGASVEKVEIEYYRRLNGAAAPDEQTTGSTTIPEYIAGCTYYTRSVTYLDDNGQHITKKGQWIEDTALTEETQKAYEAWVNAAEATSKTARLIYSEVKTDDRDAGLAVVGGLTTSKSEYGYNTIMASDYLGLRYNTINLATLSTTRSTDFTPELAFYIPTYQIDQETGALQPIQGIKGLSINSNTLNIYNPGINGAGNKGLELNANGLYLYKPLADGEVSQLTAAQLTTTGLNITEGSITLGEEKNNTFPFQVTNDGYLRAQAGWIGGENSYVKLEESEGDEGEVTHYLDVRLSQLDMLLNSDLYERDNIVNVLDIVAQQSDFITLWSGDMVWLYYPEPGSEYYSESHEGEPYLIYEYTNNDTNTTSYYFDAHQFNLNDYKLTQDTQILEKEYFNRLAEQIQNPTGNPKSNGWYEYNATTGEYFSTDDPLVRYIETTDQTYQEGKQYYYLDGDNYVTLEPEDWGEISRPYYEMKTYYELKFTLIDVTDYEGQSINPASQGWYEAEVSLWVEHSIYKAYNGSQIPVDENFSNTYYEIADQMYVLTNDIDINEDKTYYTRSGEGTDESPYVYTEVVQTDSSELKYYYELVNIYQLTNDSAPDVSKTYYKMLPMIQIAGLGQALKFENDSLGNQQRLIVSSARNDEQEKVQVEIDPWFINFAVRSDGILPLQWNMGYTKDLNDENDLGSTYMSMKLEDRTILSVNENNDYFLETNTGFRIQSLGMFHYRNGLAIGVV